MVEGAENVDGLAGEPRWAPDRPLSERITRRGRFRRVDPGRPGGVGNLYRWAAFGVWALLVVGAFAKAWREAGGLGGPDEEA